MWEYVKGSEEDFEGAPEWATIRTAFYWYETGEKFKGRYSFTGGHGEGQYPAYNESDERVAERRKVDNLQSRVNDANLQQAFDTVQRPAHYNQSGIECVDAIAASMSAEEFRGFLKGNVQKYVWRSEHKGGVEDYRKAQYYLDRLVKELSK